jgi:hypothetical protein
MVKLFILKHDSFLNNPYLILLSFSYENFNIFLKFFWRPRHFQH